MGIIRGTFAAVRRQAFGIAVLASAAVAFAFPSAFDEWGGVKLVSLVVPAIQIIMFGMGTTLSVDDFLRVAKRPWAVATGVALQFDPAVVTADYIAAFHRAGYYVNVWTVDDAKSALLAIERGADTVTSNRPSQLLEESRP